MITKSFLCEMGIVIRFELASESDLKSQLIPKKFELSDDYDVLKPILIDRYAANNLNFSFKSLFDIVLFVQVLLNALLIFFFIFHHSHVNQAPACQTR